MRAIATLAGRRFRESMMAAGLASAPVRSREQYLSRSERSSHSFSRWTSRLPIVDFDFRFKNSPKQHEHSMKHTTLVSALVALVTAAFVRADSPAPPPDKSVVGQLQKGGYVLYLRHFQTNPDQADTDPLNL